MYHPDCKLLSTKKHVRSYFQPSLTTFHLVMLNNYLLTEETILLNNWMSFFFELILRTYFMKYSFLICEFVYIKGSANILNMSVI